MKTFSQTVLTTVAFLLLSPPALAEETCEQVKTPAYEGTVCNGEYHGQGLQYKTDGSKHYKGNFVNGKYEGAGTLFLSDGRLEGHFSDGNLEGPGKIILDDGHLFYDGNYKKNYKSGFGKLYYVNNGGSYVGEFKYDKFDGQGELILNPDTEKSLHYVGGFKRDEFDGQGELKGRKYSTKGEFKDGYLHGHGVKVKEPETKADLIKHYGEDYADLNTDLISISMIGYEGEFKKGNISGQGTAKYSNGDSYTGLFKAAQPKETGKHLDQDGNLSSKHLIAKKVSVPTVPRRATKSGRCMVDFDINILGETENIEIVSCSDDVFAKSSIRNVKKMKFYPKMENGVAVPRLNWRKSIRFAIVDENGTYIAE